MQIVDLARAVRRRDFLAAREWVKEARRQHEDPAAFARPATADREELALAAALAELLAERAGRPPPAWSAEAGPLAEPVWLSEAARRHPTLAAHLQEASPEPFRRRRIFAFPDFLRVA